MDWEREREVVKREFDRQGYVVTREFLDADEVQELRQEIERYIVESLPRVPPQDVYFEVNGDPATIKQLVRMSEYDSYFERLLASEPFVKLAELLVGETVIGKNMQWFNKPIGSSRATPPHQDGYYFMLTPNEAITMWLALDEVGEDNGCVRYVKGSHLRGLRMHERTDTPGFSQAIVDYGLDDAQNEVAIEALPGDLLVHHSLTIHRADANRSQRRRRALGMIYYSSAANEDSQRLQEYQRELAKQVLL
ncbi:MAG: phytanoyl-CoA dioxygenase family protein [Acidobacteriota bacterium]